MIQHDICQEIIKNWELHSATEGSSVDKSIAIDEQIARIMEKQALCVVPQRKQTEEEKKMKQTILLQYAEVRFNG